MIQVPSKYRRRASDLEIKIQRIFQESQSFNGHKWSPLSSFSWSTKRCKVLLGNSLCKRAILATIAKVITDLDKVIQISGTAFASVHKDQFSASAQPALEEILSVVVRRSIVLRFDVVSSIFHLSGTRGQSTSPARLANYAPPDTAHKLSFGLRNLDGFQVHGFAALGSKFADDTVAAHATGIRQDLILGPGDQRRKSGPAFGVRLILLKSFAI